MFGLICKRLQLQLLPNYRYVRYSTTHSEFFSNTTHLTKSFSSKTSLAAVGDDSCTVSFLINSCGLSPETAKSVSKEVKFQSLERPHSVLNFLSNHGFTNTLISKVVRQRPSVLLADPGKTLLPKLEFFYSIGVSTDDLAKIIFHNPTVLGCCVKNQLIPYYNFLKSVVLHDEKIVAALKRTSWVLTLTLQKNMAPNISVLRGLGVPESFISRLVTRHPDLVCRNAEKFDEGVAKVVKMGFNPSKSTFVKAFQVICKFHESAWERRMEICRRWGWSEDEFLSAFRKQPTFMSLSEKHLMRTMDFIVNKMGWRSSDVAGFPAVLTFSLERRIIPRCSVLRVLQLKGLIKGESRLSTVLTSSKKYFLGNYVIQHQDHVPQLLDIFQGNVDLHELGLGFDELSGGETIVA